jgi:hypothetical protein
LSVLRRMLLATSLILCSFSYCIFQNTIQWYRRVDNNKKDRTELESSTNDEEWAVFCPKFGALCGAFFLFSARGARLNDNFSWRRAASHLENSRETTCIHSIQFGDDRRMASIKQPILSSTTTPSMLSSPRTRGERDSASLSPIENPAWCKFSTTILMSYGDERLKDRDV